MHNLGSKISSLRSRSEEIQNRLAFWRKEGYKPLQSDTHKAGREQPAETTNKAEVRAKCWGNSGDLVLMCCLRHLSCDDITIPYHQALALSIPQPPPDDAPTETEAPSQPHLRKATVVEPAASKSVLVVGGTDGSGTRSFVDLLNDLGVPMAVDDAGTMDVHGWEMDGGWPPLVKKVSELLLSQME